MASTTTYKGLTVQSTTPTGAAGARIDSNFKKLADRCYGITSSPTQYSSHSVYSPYSVIVGGLGNYANNEDSVVVGGVYNNVNAASSVCVGGYGNYTLQTGGVAMGRNARNNEEYSLALAGDTDTTLPGQMGFKTVMIPANYGTIAILKVGTGVPALVTVDGIVQYQNTPHFFKKVLAVYNGAIDKQQFLFKTWDDGHTLDRMYFTVSNNWLRFTSGGSHAYFGIHWTQFGNDQYYYGANSGYPYGY